MTPSLEALYSTAIKPEWLDYNGHMNVAYYVLIFDLAEEELFKMIGLGELVTKKTNVSWMVLENHITYDDEVSLRQKVTVSARIVDNDTKRLHLYLEMHTQGADGYLASTLEQMVICADLVQRKSTEFPEEVKKNIERLASNQTNEDISDRLGRVIGIRRK